LAPIDISGLKGKSIESRLISIEILTNLYIDFFYFLKGKIN
jgi:hypothetical protein